MEMKLLIVVTTVIQNRNPTMLDVAKRLDPNGRIPMIAEMQTQINPILEDMTYLEGNETGGHRGVIRTGIPDSTWRILNYGVLPSKSRTKQIMDACGIIEQFSEIDEEVFELNGANNAFRMDEDQAHIEAMGQTLATAIFYGNQQTDPEQITGLAPRYNLLSAENGGQIIDAGGTGSDNTSIWLICWSPRTIHGIYPKGSRAGIQFNDLGKETKEASDGRLMRVLRSQIKTKTGIHLKDWASVVRIANIDVSELADAGESGFDGANLTRLMRKAWFKVPQRLRGVGSRKAFYCNTASKEALVHLAVSDTSGQLTLETLKTGEPMMRYWGFPVRECDALLSTEGRVV